MDEKQILNEILKETKQKKKTTSNNFRRGFGRGKPRYFKPKFRRPPQFYGRRQGFRPSRRRNTYKIRFGQQQDLAFNNSPSFKGMGNTFTTPVSESKIVQSYFSFKDDVITFCQPIPTYLYILASATVPLHPMIYFGRTANMALNFANYSVKRAVLHYVPLIGSTSTGMIAIGSTRNCVPLSYDTTIQFNSLTQINAEINPVWMCSKFGIKDLDTTVKNMAPMNRHDIANEIFVVGSGLAGNLIASCTLFLEMSIQLSRPVPSPSLTPFNAYTQIIISAAGIRSSVVIASNLHGFVVNSTAQNIDMGEFIQAPPFPVIATDYDLNLTHNGCSVDYASVLDQGTIYVAYFTEN